MPILPCIIFIPMFSIVMPFDTATVGSTEVDVALPVGATVGWTVLDDAGRSSTCKVTVERVW